MEFSFAAYGRALDQAMTYYDRICGARSFLAAPGDDKVLLLRHDCERDLTKARTMAEIEAERGIEATYFVRVHSEYYSPLQAGERDHLRQIAALGHEIGLHYEPAFYAGEDVDLIDGVTADRDILAAIPGIGPVTTMSAHQPVLAPPDFNALRKAGMTEVYAEPATKALRYYSDSGMSFREKTFAEAVTTEPRCHFLVHPDFWNDVPVDWFDNLDARREAVAAALDTVVAREKEMLRSYLAKRAERDAAFKTALKGAE